MMTEVFRLTTYMNCDRQSPRVLIPAMLLILGLTFPFKTTVADDRFPRGSDEETKRESQKGIDKAKSNTEVGEQVGKEFGKYKDKFPEHPWKDGNPNSEEDWKQDSKKIIDDEDEFWECFDAKKIDDRCDYCDPPTFALDSRCLLWVDNTGEVWEYWWPEVEIEVNNFAISAIDPVKKDRQDLARKELIKRIEEGFRKDNLESYLKKYGATPPPDFPKGLREDPNAGQTHWAGLLPEDQSLVLEGHNYLTKLQDKASEQRTQGQGEKGKIYYGFGRWCIEFDFWFNGYLKGNPECFYDTLEPEAEVIKGWTEEEDFAKYWRIPELAAEINEELYNASTPFRLADDPKENYKSISQSSYAKERSCASYRVNTWEQEYGDLQEAVGIKGYTSDQLQRICYKGGGQLYPLTGTLDGHFSPLPSAAYLARRAIELIAKVQDGHLRREWLEWSEHGNEKRHVNKFTRLKEIESPEFTEVDKLQRVYPDKTRCFRMNEVNERDEQLFPKDIVRPEQNGSIRYVYWNKRKVCTCQYRGKVSAEELDRGDDNVTSEVIKKAFDIDNKGWGCQIFPKGEEEEARGNVEEGEIEGEDSDSVRESAKCVFPFDGTKTCSMSSY